MSIDRVKERLVSYNNHFYRDYYQYFFYLLMAIILTMTITVFILLYQILNRPLPPYKAVMPDQQSMILTPYEEPSLLPDTLTRFASKAATMAYTFNFVNYETALLEAKPYFTEAGWVDFRNAIQPTIGRIVEAQLFVSGVVRGAPVISNEGPLPDKGYSWRIQVPFLVSYTSSEQTKSEKHFVIVTIIKVPTSTNPQGIGIDQFVMR